MLVALDFRKAFDSVRWSLIFKMLEWLNFGENFIDYIRIMFTDIQSCITNSRHSSQFFTPGRGIRQGCCASPFLFNMVVEVLACLIRQNPLVRGIQYSERITKLTQFADDLTAFLSFGSDLPHLLDPLNDFAQYSGLQVNKNKSKIIAPSLLKEGVDHILDIPIVQRAKILGIWLDCEDSEEVSYQWNFRSQLSRIQGICDAWTNRNISIKGKITVVNSLLISILQYPCSIIHVPTRVFKEYKQLVFSFIWNGRKSKIAYDTIIKPIPAGGLHLMDLPTRVKASLIQWTRRLLAHPEMNTAASMASLLQILSVPDLFQSKDPKFIKSLPSYGFYKDLLSVWAEISCFDPQNESAIRREPLWSNQHIKWKIPKTNAKRWQDAGVATVGDICYHEQGRLLSHLEIQDRFAVPCSFLDALGLRLSVPLRWRELLTDNWRQDYPPPSGPEILIGINEPADITQVSPKKAYQDLLLSKDITNVAFARWMEEEPSLRIQGSDEWTEICTRTFVHPMRLSSKAFNTS